MLPPTPTPSRAHHGISRREALQVGYSGLLGLGLTSLPTSKATASQSSSSSRQKSVIIVYLTGGASHLDTFDPKPDAPTEIRGEFKAASTRVPGLILSEHVPHLAARTDKY